MYNGYLWSICRSKREQGDWLSRGAIRAALPSPVSTTPPPGVARRRQVHGRMSGNHLPVADDVAPQSTQFVFVAFNTDFSSSGSRALGDKGYPADEVDIVWCDFG